MIILINQKSFLKANTIRDLIFHIEKIMNVSVAIKIGPRQELK